MLKKGPLSTLAQPRQSLKPFHPGPEQNHSSCSRSSFSIWSHPTPHFHPCFVRPEHEFEFRYNMFLAFTNKLCFNDQYVWAPYLPRNLNGRFVGTKLSHDTLRIITDDSHLSLGDEGKWVGEMIASQVRTFIGTSSFNSWIVLPPRSPYSWISTISREVKV